MRLPRHNASSRCQWLAPARVRGGANLKLAPGFSFLGRRRPGRSPDRTAAGPGSTVTRAAGSDMMTGKGERIGGEVDTMI